MARPEESEESSGDSTPRHGPAAGSEAEGPGLRDETATLRTSTLWSGSKWNVKWATCKIEADVLHDGGFDGSQIASHSSLRVVLRGCALQEGVAQMVYSDACYGKKQRSATACQAGCLRERPGADMLHELEALTEESSS